MPFETAIGLATFDLASGVTVPSVSPILYEMLYRERDRAFLSRVRDGEVVPNTRFSWWERTLRPMVVVANEGATFSTTDTTLTVASGHAARIVVGAVLMDEADPRERMIVTDIAGNDLTVVRGYGGTTATAHAANFRARIVGLPAQEMSSVGLDLLRHPTEKENYTQIVRRDLKASRSSQGVKTWVGYHLNARRLNEKLEEIRDELEQIALFGVPNATTPGGSDTQLRTTGGLLHYVGPYATPTPPNINTTTFTAQTALTLKTRIDEGVRWLVENGADPNFVMAGSDLYGAIMDLDSDKVRFEVNDGVRGAVVTAIRSKFGATLDVVLDRWFPPRFLLIGDYRKVSMRLFANGGNPHIEQLAKTRDGDEFMIIGELGFQVENGQDAFYLFRDVNL